MAEIKFTEEQLNAIEARGGTILVSAAAGSGKTAVLIERVMRLLTGKREGGKRSEPIPADRLLVVTFTKAAASEMRERLRRALDSELSANPFDEALKRQRMLLQKAHIETIDSFCLSCLREFFALAGAAPDFRIADNIEIELLRTDVLSALMDECFEQPSEDFRALLEFVGNEKSDGDENSSLTQLIDRLEKFISAYPYPDEKLRELLAPFESAAEPQDTPWGKYLLYYTGEMLEYLRRMLERTIKAVSDDEELSAAQMPLLEHYEQSLQSLISAVDSGDWSSLAALFSSVQLPTQQVKGHSGAAELVRAFKGEFKSQISTNLPQLFSSGADEFTGDSEKLLPVIRELCRLTALYSERIAGAKQERGLMYFSDMEHKLAEICTEPRGGQYYRSDVAVELSSRFDEILIDEYQDTNYIQDLIFRSISKEGGRLIGNGENLFMVGDVKQSIYGFRKAVPRLFMSYLESFSPYDPKNPVFPAAITLSKNFRSRPEVTDFVNFVFSKLMRDGRGGVEYDTPEQRLCCSMKNPPEAPDRETELHILGCRGLDDERDVIEARYCARLIRQMVSDKYEIIGKNGMRPCTTGDFCIMRRALNNGHGDAFVSQLESLGIPVSIVLDRGFFDASEIRIILSLLRAIDNPSLDISMLAALRSPVFGFNCDRLVELRCEGRRESIYSCLLRLAEKGDREAQDARELFAYFRTQAAFLPSDGLISAIYHRTGLPAFVLAMPHGEPRRRNLQLLLDKAAEFESNGFKGLSRFIAFIDRIIAANVDFAPAQSVSDERVKVRTMHSVKGLQFPICIIAGLGSSMNDKSSKGNLLLHGEYSSRARRLLQPAESGLGIGASLRDGERRVRYTTAHRLAAVQAIRESDIDEELRLLYVAMTRAVDKLILISAAQKRSSVEALLDKAALMVTADYQIDSFSLGQNRCTGLWLIACAMLHPDGGVLRKNSVYDDMRAQDCAVPLKIKLVDGEDELLLPVGIETEECPELPPPDENTIESVLERLNYVYPFASLNQLPAKVTASSIHDRGAATALTRPSFAADSGLSPSEKGTALHRFMQFCNFEAAASNAEAELERLINGGFLREREGIAVDLSKVERFFSGETGRLIAAATKYEREWRFTAPLPPELLPLFTSAETHGERVIIEGECDLLIEYEDEALVIDYKTDRVSSPEPLTERYSDQLRIYAAAVREILQKPVKRCYIYSFALDLLIPVEL